MRIARIGTALVAVAALLAAIWLLEVVDLVTGGALRLDAYGITPRRTGELVDIFTAPFLHVGFGHVLANTVPLAVLGVLVALKGLRRLAAVSLVVIVVGGLGVWLIAPPNSVTLGASILVFGYFGYVLAYGFVTRRWADIAIAAVVGLLYWTMLFGLLPLQQGVSWQGHLFGLLGGVLAGWLLGRGSRGSRGGSDRSTHGAHGTAARHPDRR